MADTCCFCKQTITENQEFCKFPDGREVHSTCWKCGHCMKPLKKFLLKDGVYLCADCVKNDPDIFCSICKKEIGEGQKYKEYTDGRVVHQACFNEPTLFCGVCKKEIDYAGKHMRLTDGREVHWECWRCTDCQVYLVDYYLRNEKDPYCGCCYRKLVR